ncbi:MAG: fatty acid desaturase [Myxococcota bacterium]
MTTSATLRSYNSTGLVIAMSVIGAWLAGLTFWLTHPVEGVADIPWAIFAVALQTFLSTGLFITAHDAMHGTVAPRNRSLNDLIGGLAVRLYALFSFSELRQHHGLHHAHPGESGQDPDFHDGTHRSFFGWYLGFMRRYLTWQQVVGMAVIFNLLVHVANLSTINVVLFWVVPALASTFQLFYFGTYLPHRRPQSPDDPHHARSSNFAPWLSLLTCYHFGYHREHHEHPEVPWWQLPTIRWEQP